MEKKRLLIIQWCVYMERQWGWEMNNVRRCFRRAMTIGILSLVGLSLLHVPSVHAGWPDITAPDAGDTLVKGNTYTILWSSVHVAKVNIKLCKELPDELLCFSVIAVGVPNSGSYSWTVPSSLANGSSYVVSAGVIGISVAFSDTFTITDPSGPQPLADFSVLNASGAVPFAVQFSDQSTGNITNRFWTFGNGQTSTATNPVHTYQYPGTYTVALNVSGPGGSNTKTRNAYINVIEAAPVANFSAVNIVGVAPLSVQFDDQSTRNISSRIWTFGDGQTSTALNPVHIYQDQGSYTVTLEVSGPGGKDTKTISSYVNVSFAPPVVDFSANTTGVLAPFAVQFTDQSTGKISSWEWDFGDGAVSVLQNPSHIYTSPGHYTVVLTVAGPGGEDSAMRTDYITVYYDVADINGDARVDLTDVISIVQLLTNSHPMLRQDKVADLNGDGKFGIEEAIYILKIIANENGSDLIRGSIKTVSSAGQVWMDRNLGASRGATSFDDEEAFGDLYQWGRGADGHQKRTSATTSTSSSTDEPGHSNFIIPQSSKYDWRNPQNDTLWQGADGINNPCPSGFRLPTSIELQTELATWSSNNAAGAFASPLKLVVAGQRGAIDGVVSIQGKHGQGKDAGYWSSTVEGRNARALYFLSDYVLAIITDSARGYGYSVRCLKD